MVECGAWHLLYSPMHKGLQPWRGLPRYEGSERS